MDAPPVCVAVDRRARSDDRDALGAGVDDRTDAGVDHAEDDFIRIVAFQAVEGDRRHRVAGGHDQLHAARQHEFDVLVREADDRIDRFVPVRHARRVSEIGDRFARKRAAQRGRDGEPAEAGVENTDGPVVEWFHELFLPSG